MLPTVLSVVKHLQSEQDRARRFAERHFSTIKDGYFSAIGLNETEFSLMPFPEFGAMIYRGQVAYHEPCLPSLFRGRPSKVDRLERMARSIEFELCLDRHPAVVEPRKWSIDGLYFRIDYEAIAQHYMFPTAILDFTSSPLVAAFFASCEFDPVTETYRPITTNNERGPGVLYALNAAAHMTMPATSSSIGTVGAQPLRRPAEQYAWGYRLTKGKSLNSLSFLTAYRFRHTPRDAVSVFEAFDGGAKLFPYDPVVAKAREILSARSISRRAVEIAIDRQVIGRKRDSYISAISSKGIKITDSEPYQFNESEMQSIESDWLSRREKFYSSVHFRMSYSPPVEKIASNE